jgi:hypothetical protein
MMSRSFLVAIVPSRRAAAEHGRRDGPSSTQDLPNQVKGFLIYKFTPEYFCTPTRGIFYLMSSPLFQRTPRSGEPFHQETIRITYAHYPVSTPCDLT